jgi:hypothetical protein
MIGIETNRLSSCARSFARDPRQCVVCAGPLGAMIRYLGRTGIDSRRCPARATGRPVGQLKTHEMKTCPSARKCAGADWRRDG